MSFNTFSIMSLWQIMETFECGKLMNAVVYLSNLAHAGTFHRPNGVPLREYGKMKDDIDFICTELERFGLDVSLFSARELRSVIYESPKEMGSGQPDPETAMWFMPLDFARYKSYSIDLVTRLTDELSTKVFMVLPSEMVGLLNGSKQPFSRDIQSKFPSVIHDMDEAGRCLALGRHTACVFHLMRIMESALKTLATELSVQLSPKMTWQNVLDKVNTKIKSLDQNDSKTKQYASISANLYNMKLAWRNEVMHPKETYSKEDAERIFAAVRLFLDELVSVL